MQKSAFSLEIADVVFGERVSKKRMELESLDIERFTVWFAKASLDLMHRKCAEIDKELIAKLSGPSMLKVARLIEARFPEIIENMPNLAKHQQQLTRARTMEQVFMPSSLVLLAQALETEGSP